MRTLVVISAAAAALLVIPACFTLYGDVGYNDHTEVGGVTGAGVGGGGSVSSSGSAGVGGSGVGGGAVCIPGSTTPCYSGPVATQGVGACKAGTKTCNVDGMSYAACAGEVTPSPENCATPADDNCDGVSPQCSGTHLWSKGFGDVANQRGLLVATDAAGNVFTAGEFAGKITLGAATLTSAGGTDVYLAKLDPMGVVLWAKRFGNAVEQHVGGLAVDAQGNVVLAGDFDGSIDLGGGALSAVGQTDAFLAKLDGNGAHLWSKRFGDASYQIGKSVAVSATGEIALVGMFDGTIDLGGGPLVGAGGKDAFLARFSASGAHLWSKRFGGGGDQSPRGVAIDGSGNVVVLGDFDGTIDLGGGPLSGDNQDLFLGKLSASGVHLWSKRFGDAAYQLATSLAVDAKGNVLLGGQYNGTLDFGGGGLKSTGDNAFLAKLDGAGAHLWSKRYGAGGVDSPQAVMADGVGNIVVVGYFNSTLDFGGAPLVASGFADIFVAKLDSAGNPLWSKRFGDPGAQFGRGGAVDSSGNVLLTGYFTGTVDFGGNALVSAGGTDMFLVKLSP